MSPYDATAERPLSMARERFEEHLETCESCRAELAGLQDTAAALAFAVIAINSWNRMNVAMHVPVPVKPLE